MEEIGEEIRRTKPGKAPGHDGIKTDMLIALSDTVQEEMRLIINTIMKEEEGSDCCDQ